MIHTSILFAGSKKTNPKKRAWDRVNRTPFIPTRAGRIHEHIRLTSIYVLLDAHKLNASIKVTPAKPNSIPLKIERSRKTKKRQTN